MTAWRGLDLQAAELSGTAACFSATVTSTAAEALILDRNGQALTARLALGCVYLPEPGDTVLVAPTAETLWVINLLARPTTQPLRMVAPHGLSLESGGTLHVRAPLARVAIDELRHAGQRLTAQLTELSITANLSRLMAKLSLLHAGSAVREVEGLDQVKAGSIEQRASTSLQMSAENTFLAADNLVRVDAGQVHIG